MRLSFLPFFEYMVHSHTVLQPRDDKGCDTFECNGTGWLFWPQSSISWTKRLNSYFSSSRCDWTIFLSDALHPKLSLMASRYEMLPALYFWAVVYSRRQLDKTVNQLNSLIWPSLSACRLSLHPSLKLLNVTLILKYIAWGDATWHGIYAYFHWSWCGQLSKWNVSNNHNGLKWS